MNILYNFLLLLSCIIAVLSDDARPFYSLPGPYHFTGSESEWIQLTDLVCVKGNDARSIQLQLKTNTSPPSGYGTLIGKIMTLMLVVIYML